MRKVMDSTRKNTLVLGLLICVHLAEYSLVFCDGISWTKYLYSNDFADNRYVPNETVFNAEATDPFTCGKMCHNNENCASFSYQQSTRLCRGCKLDYCGAQPANKSNNVAISQNFSPGPRYVRVVGGAIMYQGILEVFHDGQWGGVCESGFPYENNTKVACRMLNPAWHDVEMQRISTSDAPPIVLNKLVCSGSEKSLFDCDHLDWGENKCDGGKYVQITCRPSNYFLVRLVGNDTINQYRGRLELAVLDGPSDMWGAVCGDQFDNNAAKVVCRMLGHQTTNAVAYSIGHNHTEWSFDYIRCTGSEETLASCFRNSWNRENCDGSEVIWVACD